MATKTTRNYFRIIAPDYIKKTLSHLVYETIANPKDFEIDYGTSTLPKEKIAENRENLSNLAQKYLDAIVASLNNIPLNMRKFFNVLRQLVKQCFPESELRAIGAFFFLRFVCPAIVAPQGFKVVEDIVEDPEARRALTLVAKVLQNLANESSHFREEFMEPLNPFLQRNAETMAKFFDELSTIPENGPADAWRPKFTDEDRFKCLSLLVGQLKRNMNNVEKFIDADPRMKDPEKAVENKKYLASLKELIAVRPS